MRNNSFTSNERAAHCAKHRRHTLSDRFWDDAAQIIGVTFAALMMFGADILSILERTF